MQRQLDAGHRLFLGIDVGTGSVRAALFDANGHRLPGGSGETNGVSQIKTWTTAPDDFEQSSDDIWNAVRRSVADVMRTSNVAKGDIQGVGFDATCSLVVLGKDDVPLSIARDCASGRNIMLWMDHRAVSQADRINATEHVVLKSVGGIISPEMETPKLLWIRENLPDVWRDAVSFFDLADFLTYRATGVDVRSLCTVTCKWTFQSDRLDTDSSTSSIVGWDESYFREIGLGDLADEGFRRIGTIVRPMGERVGNGLNKEAAEFLGLEIGTPVSVGVIDAHAGGLGLLGAQMTDGECVTPSVLETRLALISGTSSCHMAVSRDSVFVPGVWGPYFSAMVPGLWLAEGGQSATGKLVDHVIQSHACTADLEKLADGRGVSLYDVLNEKVNECAERLGLSARCSALVVKDVHVCPYFHGNRSPRADPSLNGMISGLRLSHNSIEGLALLYLATIQAIAHGTRHIIERMNESGHHVESIFITGGLSKNSLFVREHADICGCSVVLSKEQDAVLLGSAVLAAVAAGEFPSALCAMQGMNHIGRIEAPTGDASIRRFHNNKHSVFLQMYEDQMRYRSLMEKL